MPLFSTAQALLAAGHTVFRNRLVEFRFTAGTMRLWIDGFGSLVVGGDTWTGTGEIVSISDITVGTDDMATRVDFGVSGVDADFVALAKSSEDLRGTEALVWLAMLDEDLQPVDSKMFLHRCFLDVATYSGVGAALRSINIPGETLWTHRNHAAHAYYSDVDQQARFPGDKGLERLILYTGDHRVSWPGPGSG